MIRRKPFYTRLFGYLPATYWQGTWVYDYGADLRTPLGAGVPFGPWLTAVDPRRDVSGVIDPVAYCQVARREAHPVHGIVSRDHPDGMTEWVAVNNGWPLFHWAGPRMTWTHPLVSPWNPILAQNLTDERRIGYPRWFDVPDGHDDWTYEAILSGRKPAGYFGRVGYSRRSQKIAVAQLREGGFTVERIGRQRLSTCCWAAAPGLLCEVFGHDSLQALADAYRRVFTAWGMCPGMADDTEACLHDYAHTSVMDLAIHHEEIPDPICGLVLGYPPEVTAGLMMRREWRPDEWGISAEVGAFDEHERYVIGPSEPAGVPA